MNRFERKTGVYKRVIEGEEKDFDFEFQTDINMESKLTFVNLVVGNLVKEDTKTYFSAMLDLIFNYVLVQRFTNIDVNTIVGEDDKDSINKIEEFFDNSNVIEILKANIESDVIDSLYKSVLDNIEYKTGVRQNNILGTINSILKVIEDKTKELDISKLMESAEKLNAIKDGFTPEKILEAYANTSMFTENKATRKKSTAKTSTKKTTTTKKRSTEQTVSGS